MNLSLNHKLATATIASVLLASGVSAALGGSVASPYEIGPWQGFRPAALSYTFDDNCPNQYAVAVPMFNARGFKMTLFTVVNWVGSWSSVQNAASFGHEIASHTLTHPVLSGLSDAQQTNELKNSQAAIDANVPGQKCVTLAYPNCVEANEAITSQFYIAARTCSGQLVPGTPPNFLALSSFVCGSQGSVKTTLDFNNLASSAVAAKAWCVYLIHAIDNDSGYSPLSSAVLQGALDYAKTNQDKFWVETFGNVARYIRERNAASVAETSTGSSAIALQVTTALDNSIYNYPLTLRRPLPTNWMAATVTQSNQPVTAQLTRIGLTNFLMFDAVPNGGEVIISKLNQRSSLSSPAVTGSNSFTFLLTGLTGVRYAVQSSADLVNWSSLQTNVLLGTATNITASLSNTCQFYRAQWVP
jgi:hypothetical protein